VSHKGQWKFINVNESKAGISSNIEQLMFIFSSAVRNNSVV